MDTSNNTVSNLQVLDAVDQAARDSQATSCMDTTAIVQSQDFTNLENMAGNERLALAIEDDVYKASQHNRNAIERTGHLLREVTDNHGTAIALAIERTGAEEIASIESSSANILSTVERDTGNILTAQTLNQIEVRDLMYKHDYSNIENSKEILLNDNKNAVNVEHQAVVNTYKTKKDLVCVESNLELQAVKDTASIQLEAVKLQSESAAEMAACCCELKVQVAKTEYDTQQMARDIESKRIREALAAATTENLINKLKPKCRPPPCPPPPCPCEPPV
jgi:hypothetical protein